jgi:catechol 2,3-dioxygenase-like lactoylglutathione lyase family enzyme
MKLDSAVLYTNDVKKATEFYRDFLGLKLDYVEEGKFASFLFENGVRLSIKKAIEEREKPGSQTVFIAADDIENIYQKFKTAGAVFGKELKVASWGTEFSILDPDGNKVEFIKRSK